MYLRVPRDLVCRDQQVPFSDRLPTFVLLNRRRGRHRPPTYVSGPLSLGPLDLSRGSLRDDHKVSSVNLTS